ncbi:MAG TPA: hypothetical protein DEP72_03170 [Clostridiales bacterium]|nr:MAG: hypothetical protein A2Y18_04490 [Clostridiales bacterium GWD2_32_19]HCC07153.1 hypothetical protein [Clostridiales bacterium]
MQALALKTDLNVLNLKASTSFKIQNKRGNFEEILSNSRESLKTNRNVSPKPKNIKREPERKEIKEDDKPIEDTKKDTTKTENKDKTENKTENKTEDTKTSDSEEKLKKMAEKLGITEENLTNILQSLNIKIDEIKDLAQIKNIVKEVFKLETDNDILKDPNASDILKSIKDLLDIKDLKEPKGDISVEDIKAEDQELTNVSDDKQSKINKNNKLEDVNSEDINDNDVNKISVEQTQKNAGDEKNNKENGKEELPKILSKDGKENKEKINMEIRNENNNSNILETTKNTMMKYEKLDDISNGVKQTKTVDPQNLMKQILENAKMTLSAEKSEIIIKLKPENLGKITMSVVTEEGMLKAKFVAETQKVKETIEANLDDLKQSLKDKGLNLDAVEVSVRQDNSNQQQNLYKEEQAKSKTYKKNLIDKLMNINSVDTENSSLKPNPYMVSDSQFDYIA